MASARACRSAWMASAKAYTEWLSFFLNICTFYHTTLIEAHAHAGPAGALASRLVAAAYATLQALVQTVFFASCS